MLYREPKDRGRLVSRRWRAGFRRVEKYAPFLVQYESGRLRLRDGNHRYAALGSLHMGECWIIGVVRESGGVPGTTRQGVSGCRAGSERSTRIAAPSVCGRSRAGRESGTGKHST